MIRFFVFLIMIIIPFMNIAYAVSKIAKQKYPYSLLTNDYGILNENDLGDLAGGLKQKKLQQRKARLAHTIIGNAFHGNM